MVIKIIGGVILLLLGLLSLIYPHQSYYSWTWRSKNHNKKNKKEVNLFSRFFGVILIILGIYLLLP